MAHQEHGGNADLAAKLFGFAPKDMLDLSTGVSPIPYPAPRIESHEWHRLPTEKNLESCLQAARSFYQVPSKRAIMAGSGSQSLLQLIPYLFRPSNEVWISMPGYNEHGAAWKRAGHTVKHTEFLPQTSRYAVMIIPNNPTGEYNLAEINSVAKSVKARDGWLIIDGAFMHPSNNSLLAGLDGAENIVQLRSFGKFFGLAGLRIGFAIGPSDFIERLNTAAGPWAVSSAALKIAAQALMDRDWQNRHLSFLDMQCARLTTVLKGNGCVIRGGTNLFQTIITANASSLHKHLAHHGIWTRQFTLWPNLLRIGVPANEDALQKLDESLKNWRSQTNR